MRRKVRTEPLLKDHSSNVCFWWNGGRGREIEDLELNEVPVWVQIHGLVRDQLLPNDRRLEGERSHDISKA